MLSPSYTHIYDIENFRSSVLTFNFQVNNFKMYSIKTVITGLKIIISIRGYVGPYIIINHTFTLYNRSAIHSNIKTNITLLKVANKILFCCTRIRQRHHMQV